MLFLQDVEEKIRGGAYAQPDVRHELTRLRNDLKISARLLENGTAFFRVWTALLGAGPSYSPAGQPVPQDVPTGSGASWDF